MKNTIKLDKRIARKILTTIDAGLCSGLGSPIPGQMCIEAAVNYGMGLPHGDQPQCVHPVIRAFKIALNDNPWSSNKARAKGLRRIGIAQLGSTEIDGDKWIAEVVEQHIRQIVPISLKIVASMIPSHKKALLAAAKRCEKEGTKAAAYAARAAANAAANAANAADAAAYAANAAASAANAAAYAAAYAARAAANAAAYAAANAAAKTNPQALDEIYTLSAEIAVAACIKLKTQGSKWLDICANS